MDARFLAALAGIALAACVQGTPLAGIFGTKPDIVLASVFFAAFLARDLSRHASVAAFAALLLVPSLPSPFYAASLFIIFLSGYFVRRAAAWQPWFSYPASLIVATFLLHALIGARFLAAHPGMVFREGLYTAIFGAFLYALIGYPHETSRRHTF